MRCASIPVLITLVAAPLVATTDAAPTRLTMPHGVALDRDGNVLATCRGGRNTVVVMTRDGKTLREFGADHLADPGGLAVGQRGRIIVASAGKSEAVAFDAGGKRLTSIGGLGRPEHISIAPDGRVFVSDAGNSRIAVLDPHLKGVLFVVDKVLIDGTASSLKNPGGTAIYRRQLYVCDTGNRRILMMAVPKEEGIVEARVFASQTEITPADIAVGKHGRIYVLDGSGIRGFTPRGDAFASFRAKAVRMWYQPKSLAVDRDGNVLSVDASTRRVLGTSAELFDEEPQLSVTRGDGDLSNATITWTTLTRRPTVLRHGPTEDCKQEYRDENPTKEHRVVLKGLPAQVRYHFHAGFPVEAVPPTAEPRADLALDVQRRSFATLSQGNFSGEYAFATLPHRGKAEWISAPTIVVVYRRVTFPAGTDGKKPEDRVLADDDIALLKSELELYRVWAWRHSSLKLNFDFTYVIVDQPRQPGMMGSATPQMLKDILAGLKEQGKDLHDYWYAIVCGTAGWYAHYLAGTVAGSQYELGTCYTGFGPGTKHGWWWFPTHEHGHLVHSWAMCSGCSFFAFPDAPWTLPGQFGENFSFLAYNYRQLPVRDWLILKRGVLRQSADTNSNGVPDDDPRVPLDEKRFGWTEAMGGDCLTRIMAGGRTPGYPHGTDTDFDGVVHKLNKGELYWIDRNIPRGKIKLDGKLGTDEWYEFYSLPNVATPKQLRGLKAKLYLAWDDDHYYFAIKSDSPVIAGFDLDAANDGWFHGRDNLRFSVRPPTKGRPPEAGGSIWDFLNDRINLHNGQHWYKDAYKPGDIKAATGEQDGWHLIECAVPARSEERIVPGRGRQFALRVYLWSDTAGKPIPQTNFFDGEDFVYDLLCVNRKGARRR